MINKLALTTILAPGVTAFAPSSTSRAASSSTSLRSTVDPTVITKKEYQDICGVSFDDANLAARLQKTSYLYPKHVEVIEDFAPMVDEMVDSIVSCYYCYYCPIVGWLIESK